MPKKPKPSKAKTPRSGELAELLKKPFSLTDCKRVVALAEEWSDLVQKKAYAASQTKALQKKYNEGDETHELEKIALKMVRNHEAKAKCTADIKATLSDLTRIILEELADGATVWAAAENAGKEEQEGQEPDDPAQGSLHEEPADEPKRGKKLGLAS